MKKPRTKGQHFVPRFYLQHFADSDGLVWTYDFLEDRVSTATPENTAVQTNFYSPVDDNGNHIDELENFLADIESNAAPLYPKLIDGSRLTDQEKGDLGLFFSSLYLRSPAIINSSAEVLGYLAQQVMKPVLADRADFETSMNRYDEERAVVTPATMRNELFEFMNDRTRYQMTVDRKVGLMAMGSTPHLAEILCRMRWTVLKNETQHLIACDSPVARLTPPDAHHPVYGDGGFLNERSYVSVPLTPERVLVMHWGDQTPDGVHETEKQNFRLFNRQRAHFAERYLYASRQDSGIRALGSKHKDPGVRMTTSGVEDLARVAVKRRIN